MAALDVQAQIKSILAEQFAVLESSLSMTTSLVFDLGADSLDLTEIIMEMEERWGWEISMDLTDPMRSWTVQDLVDYVEKRLKAKGR